MAGAAVLGEASECEIYTGQTSILDRVEDRHEAHDREDSRNIRLSGKVVGFSRVSSVAAITPSVCNSVVNGDAHLTMLRRETHRSAHSQTETLGEGDDPTRLRSALPRGRIGDGEGSVPDTMGGVSSLYCVVPVQPDKDIASGV